MSNSFTKNVGKIWKNKWLILEGLWNRFLGKHRKIVKERLDICKTCRFYDKKGESDPVVFKGLPACGVCGCHLLTLLSCVRGCNCSLEDIGEEPLWTSK